MGLFTPCVLNKATKQLQIIRPKCEPAMPATITPVYLVQNAGRNNSHHMYITQEKVAHQSKQENE
jgi:hypothetical protein